MTLKDFLSFGLAAANEDFKESFLDARDRDLTRSFTRRAERKAADPSKFVNYGGTLASSMRLQMRGENAVYISETHTVDRYNNSMRVVKQAVVATAKKAVKASTPNTSAQEELEASTPDIAIIEARKPSSLRSCLKERRDSVLGTSSIGSSIGSSVASNIASGTASEEMSLVEQSIASLRSG